MYAIIKMLAFSYWILYTLTYILLLVQCQEIRDVKSQRLCKTVESPTGTVLESSPRRTTFQCTILCGQFSSCTVFSFKKVPSDGPSTCTLYGGTVSCGTESLLPFAWYTYNFGDQLYSCPDGWDAYAHSCYLLVPVNKTWPDSRDNCDSMGSVLASIKDESENQFIMDLPVNKGYGNRCMWLGGHDHNTEGQWEWLSGEPMIFTKFVTPEPDGGYNENEMGIWTSGLWFDLPWDSVQFSVCEITIS